MTFATIAVLRAGFCDRGSCIYPKSVIKPTFQSISSFSGLFMPYQHFFMFHDVTWARHSKQASSALENNVAPIRSRRNFSQRSPAMQPICSKQAETVGQHQDNDTRCAKTRNRRSTSHPANGSA